MSHSYCAHGIDVENYNCNKCPPGELAALRDIVADHVATLETVGFGGECEIDGAAAVDAVNDHFERLRDALANLSKICPREKHGEGYKWALTLFPDD